MFAMKNETNSTPTVSPYPASIITIVKYYGSVILSLTVDIFQMLSSATLTLCKFIISSKIELNLMGYLRNGHNPS